jgi:hypothetical protein
VLPKPFTKEGLLSMLEKHLGHLKKHPQQPLDLNPVQPSAPAKRSYRSDDSPATSPATVSNWNSPGNIGVSPASAQVEDSYLHPTHNNAGPGHPSYAMPPQAGMPPPPVQAPMYGGASLPPGGLGPRPPVLQHRRGISDISGGPSDMGDAKRQQLYGGARDATSNAPTTWARHASFSMISKNNLSKIILELNWNLREEKRDEKSSYLRQPFFFSKKCVHNVLYIWLRDETAREILWAENHRLGVVSVAIVA